MIFLVSDLHLGKDPSTDTQSLSELAACIDSFSGEVTQVVFLGDTFDAYIEYPGRQPEPVERWVEYAKELQARGIDITFFAGNHDRWHRTYVLSSLNIEVRRAPEINVMHGKRVWLEHGDQAAPHSPIVRIVRTMAEWRLALSVYCLVLPFGLGQRLAAYVSRNFSNFEPDQKTIQRMKKYAVERCASHDADVVVMGHCHQAALVREPGSLYVNTGDWYRSRTFAVLGEADSLHTCSLYRWTENGAEKWAQEIF